MRIRLGANYWKLWTASVVSREVALRAPFLLAAAVFAALLGHAIPKLNTDRIEAAKAAPIG